MEPDNLDDDLVNAWATGLVDDGLWNNASAVNRVNQFLAGSVPMHLRFTDDDGRSSGSSSPGSVGSVETLIASHFGGINHPSLFSDHRILDLHNPWRSQARIGIVSLRVVHLLMTVIAHLR